MQDGYRREINYLRVSVTDRCNLRCVYCMPAQGIKSFPHGEILRLEEIHRVVQAATLVGVKKVRITGGEPLVRKGLKTLIQAIASTPEIDDIAITTNGTLLAGQVGELKEAGLQRVNISLDSLRAHRYHQVTRGGCMESAWAGIKAALELEMHPVKLNVVVIRGFNDDEIVDLAGLSLEYPLHIRFIELMPVGAASSWAKEAFFPASEIRKIIQERFGPLREVHKMAGSGPARYYTLAGAAGTIGFITAVSDHFCKSCNRLRLTASGGLRPCLYRAREIDVKGPLRRGASLEELASLVRQAIKSKPGGHQMSAGEYCGNLRVMSRIGG